MKIWIPICPFPSPAKLLTFTALGFHQPVEPSPTQARSICYKQLNLKLLWCSSPCWGSMLWKVEMSLLTKKRCHCSHHVHRRHQKNSRAFKTTQYPSARDHYPPWNFTTGLTIATNRWRGHEHHEHPWPTQPGKPYSSQTRLPHSEGMRFNISKVAVGCRTRSTRSRSAKVKARGKEPG